MENKQVKRLMGEVVSYVDDSNRKLGGQQAGMQHFPIVVESKELEIKISCGYHRSNYKNKETAMLLMELAISHI